jgi:hypothetical protein
MDRMRRLSAVRWAILGATVLLVAVLAFGVWTNEVWRPWVPACARGDPATCLQSDSVHWIPLVVDPKTGTSGPFTVRGTILMVRWSVTVPEGGCVFSLLLGGPGGKLSPSLFTPPRLDAGAQSGEQGYADVGPGTFFLQEDRSQCTGAWTGSFSVEP